MRDMGKQTSLYIRRTTGFGRSSPMDLSLDELVSTGIAAAQKASVESDPRLRVYHLRRAREILMKALKQAGERGLSEEKAANLRLHLTAVLLKLGEKPETLVDISASPMRERAKETGDETPATAARDNPDTDGYLDLETGN